MLSLQILIDISEKPKIHAKDVFDVAGHVLSEKAVKHDKIFSIFNNWLQFFLKIYASYFNHCPKFVFVYLLSTLNLAQGNVALARVVQGEKATFRSHIKKIN